MRCLIFIDIYRSRYLIVYNLTGYGKKALFSQRQNVECCKPSFRDQYSTVSESGVFVHE